MLCIQLLSTRDGVAFDFVTRLEHGTVLSREDALRCQVVQAFMVPPGVVVGDKVFDLPYQFSWQFIMLQQDAVLERAVPSCQMAGRGGCNYYSSSIST